MFKACTEASLRLFFQDRKLYEIAASAATERWQSVLAYEERIQKLLREVCRPAASPATSSARRRWTKPPWRSIW
jgi:hypothetical protein